PVISEESSPPMADDGSGSDTLVRLVPPLAEDRLDHGPGIAGVPFAALVAVPDTGDDAGARFVRVQLSGGVAVAVIVHHLLPVRTFGEISLPVLAQPPLVALPVEGQPL